jgi:hypothetical protein
MFEQSILVSEAFRQSAAQMQGSLRMAMKGCIKCGTRQMIAEPILGKCAECGGQLQLIED